ncbi:hypothetical protein ACFW2T_33155, partial [Streptomyces sp. NPDC058892]
MPTSKKRKKRNLSRPHGARSAVVAPADEFDTDAVITIRQLHRDKPSTVIPGPGNRAGFSDGENTFIPRAVLFDTRLQGPAVGIYGWLLTERPPFRLTWDEVTTLVLEAKRRDSNDEIHEGLAQLREHGYLVPCEGGWALDVPDDAEAHGYVPSEDDDPDEAEDWGIESAAPLADGSTMLIGGADLLPENVQRVHALLTARGWAIEDYGHPHLSYPADGSAYPDPSDGWVYRPSFGGVAINYVDEAGPVALDCQLRLGDYETGSPARLVVTEAGNLNGCDEHHAYEREFRLGDGDTVDLVEVAELLDELEPLAREL